MAPNNKMIQAVPLIVPARMGGLSFKGHWKAEYDNPVLRPRTGTIKGWEKGGFEWDNLVVDVGINDALDVHLSGGVQDTTWFVFLLAGTPTVAAADTMATHAGWTEQAGYDEAARQAFVDAGVSAKSLSNTASPAVFTITANSTTVGGAGLCGDGTKSGTTGILYAAGAFSGGNVVLNAAATISITATFTGADDGV